MIRDLIQKNRSYRRFDSTCKIERNTLLELVDLARLSPSAANLQPLKYILSCDVLTNDRIFPCLAWAGYLKDWPGPDPSQRPSAYIILLGDTAIRKDFGCDHGIACQSILLGAVEKGLGGCIIGSIDRDTLRQELKIPSQFKILLVIALGKPAETIILDAPPCQDPVTYYRDTSNNHHVPKRSLQELIL